MALEYILVKGLEYLFEPTLKKNVNDFVQNVLKAWKNKDNPPLGACYFDPKPGADFWRLMDSAFKKADVIKVLCTTGYTTFGPGGPDKLAPALQQKVKGELRFLLLNPRAIDVINRRVREIPKHYSYTPDFYKSEIVNTRRVLKRLSDNKDYVPKVELKYFKHYPSCRLFIFDNIIAFVQPYLAGTLGDLAPVIGFKKKDDGFSLFHFFLEYFDRNFEVGQITF